MPYLYPYRCAWLLYLQARSQAIEAQLASTVNELRELKSRHHQLEVMLEKAHQSSQDQVSPTLSESEVLVPRRHISLQAFIPSTAVW